ncbi:MAG: DUF4412 domain-containing protein [Bacteroidales bacterium]|mgnify:CR=1 FL=1|nr:DUF4412 domain-containing protein [Bacteroidales bacterium]
MRNRYSSFLALIIILLSLFSAVYGSTFKGNINFVRETVFDTIHINIYVRDAMVRIDERDTKNRIVSSHIVNLDKEEVYALSYSKQQYVKILANNRSNDNEYISVKKTQNTKEINGHKCYQWRVRDEGMNTEVAYWMYDGEFEFFAKLFNLLRRTEYSLAIFSAIPDVEGFIPMLTEERTLLRKDKLKIRIVSIEHNNPSATLFGIPDHFKSTRRLS